jgi:preprotein translocase subunit YajC
MMKKNNNNTIIILVAMAAMGVLIYFIINRNKKDNSKGSSDVLNKGTGTGTGGTETTSTIIDIAPLSILEVNKDPNSIFYNQYTLSTTLTLINPPKSGTLTVSIDNKVTGTFPLPLKGITDLIPNNTFYLSFEKADGLEHTLTAAISGTKVTKSVKFTAPNA